VQALFFRDYRKFHGGALKVWDYFTHTRAAPGWDAWVQFTPRSNWDPSNPWHAAPERVLRRPFPGTPDLFFVAGRDWLQLDRHPAAGAGIPVVNLIQHVRHADEGADHFGYLERRAIRVCVGEEIAAAVRGSGVARGPVVVIPLGLDLSELAPGDDGDRDIDVAIAALKNPDLGADLARRLAAPGRRVAVLAELMPRAAFLDRLRRAWVTVFLPNRAEGVHMPPLEGMALGTLVVCPDVPGVEYCRDGVNCLRPPYDAEALAAAAERMLGLPAEALTRVRDAARSTAERHGLDSERAAFLALLDDLPRLWSGGGGG
jgi:hypothetical protein